MNVNDRERAQRRYRELHHVVGEALRRHDPQGLISMGAPLDEYDPEVGTIVPRLDSVTCLADVTDLLHEQFVARFGADQAGPADLYAKAARDVWEGWLLSEARRLSGEDDVEAMRVEDIEVLYDGEALSILTAIRVGARYFVEGREEPGTWWMGERRPDGHVFVWGNYGAHTTAFSQH